MHSSSSKKAFKIIGFTLLGIAALAMVLSQFVSVNVTQRLVPADPLWTAINDDAPLSDIESILDADSSIAARRFPGGEFPIVHAVMAKRADIVKLLLERGADPNVPGQLGSPLSIAALGNDVETGRILLEHGADQEVPAFMGMTVAQICQDDDHQDFRALLDTHFREPVCMLARSLRDRRCGILKLSVLNRILEYSKSLASFTAATNMQTVSGSSHKCEQYSSLLPLPRC